MKNGIYGLQDRNSGRIEEIYSMASDGTALKQLSMLIEARMDRTGDELDDKILIKMGEHDIENGEITATTPKMIPWGTKAPLEREAEKIKEE